MLMTKRFNSLFNQKIIKYSLSVIFLSMILVLVPVTADFSSINQAQAQDGNWLEMVKNGGLEQVGKAYGGGEPRDARRIVVDAIKIILGFLGIIAMVLILYAC